MKNSICPHKFWRPVLDCMPQLYFIPKYVWFLVHVYAGLSPNSSGQFTYLVVYSTAVDLQSPDPITVSLSSQSLVCAVSVMQTKSAIKCELDESCTENIDTRSHHRYHCCICSFKKNWHQNRSTFFKRSSIKLHSCNTKRPSFCHVCVFRDRMNL